MKIIRFEPVPPPAAKRNNNNHKLFLGETSFCCPHCNTESKAKFNNLIFRVLEFYCQNCGSFFKMVNPAFTAPPPPDKTNDK